MSNAASWLPNPSDDQAPSLLAAVQAEAERRGAEVASFPEREAAWMLEAAREKVALLEAQFVRRMQRRLGVHPVSLERSPSLSHSEPADLAIVGDMVFREVMRRTRRVVDDTDLVVEVRDCFVVCVLDHVPGQVWKKGSAPRVCALPAADVSALPALLTAYPRGLFESSVVLGFLADNPIQTYTAKSTTDTVSMDNDNPFY